jgi:4-hydroxy-tetrahydrodipicolinate synthase
MAREDLKNLIVGPVAPVPTPFDDNFEVDLGKMSDLVQWWIECGAVAGKCVIKIAAQAGEGEKLRESEWPALLRTAVQASNGKASIMGAIHHKDTVRAVDDVKRAQDLGAMGLQISPSILTHPNQDDHLQHYEAISNAAEIGVMVYNTPWWPFGSIFVDTFRKMVDFENIVAIKWAVPDGAKFEDIFELKNTFNIIDNTVQPIKNHRLGGRGYVQNELGIYPPHDLRIWDLMEKGRYDEAETLFNSVVPKLRAFSEKLGKTSGHKGGAKAVMKLMGRDIGEQRPPGTPLNKQEQAELRDLISSFGWPL